MDEYMLGNPKGALQEVKRATELSPNDPDAFYYLGRLYFSADNPKDALPAFQKAIELDPTSVRAHNQMGQTYEALGRLEDAEREYREAIASGEKQPRRSQWPYYNLGLLYLTAGHIDQAVAYFRQALLCNPVFPEAQVKLAVAFSKQNLPDQAIALLQTAIQGDPQNAEAHYHLAILLSKSGKQQEAQTQFALFEKYRAR
jgi:tetratricopeptide (TPR) repeat protein